MNFGKHNRRSLATAAIGLGNVQAILVGAFLLILFVSCSTTEENQLDIALMQSGENRKELEKVLDYFRNDSLKLKAARFLIENMPGHGGYEDDRLDSVKAVMKASVESNIGGYLPDSEWKRKWTSFNYRTLPKRMDIHFITAEYLIENIEHSFKVWEETPWSKNYTFEDFCEWVLPYRIGDEPLDNWRKMYYDRYKPLLDSLYNGRDMVEAVNVLARYFKRNNLFVLTTEYRINFEIGHSI